MVADDFLTGRLLVATPVLRDGIFDRTVVFLLHHDGDGALGVILNRPTEVDLLNVLPRWYTAASMPSVLFTGGPVAPAQVVALARYRPDPVTGATAIGTVDLDEEPDEERLDALRVFVGYAGWAAGQLEGEITAGGWYVAPAEAEDPFCGAPDDLWRQVLRRQPGQLALVASFPDDPSMN